MTPHRRTRAGRALGGAAGIALALALACSGGGGGGAGGGARPIPPAPDLGSAAPAMGSGGSAAAPAGPTERECEALIAHAIGLRVAELRQRLPPAQVPTDAEQAALATELRGQFLADCRGGTHRGYECAIAAGSLAELGACQPLSPHR